MKGFFRLAGALGFFAAVVWFERRRPLRIEKESKTRRTARNVAVAGLGALAIHFFESPVLYPLAKAVERRRLGLLQLVRLPKLLHKIVALLLLDYTVYLQHVLHHRVPLLWRFHAVHHVDLDLDASTALRFHFGEIAVSLPYRIAQALFIGVDSDSLLFWQSFLLLSIIFHHSNVRLPKREEDWLVRYIVTPRMHGIHHSNEPENQNSNWSGGLTLWDKLHGTLKLGVKQADIDIGVRGFTDSSRVSLPRIITLPFRDEPALRAFIELPAEAGG